MNRKYLCLIPLFLLFILSACEIDECPKEYDRYENPVVISEIIDGWIIEDESEKAITFTKDSTEPLVLTLSIDRTPDTPHGCGHIKINQNKFIYALGDAYYIIATERSGSFSVKTKEMLDDSNPKIFGNINSAERAFLRLSHLSEVSLNGKEYTDVLYLKAKSNEEFLLDQVYFQRGKGLISFEYKGSVWIRE